MKKTTSNYQVEEILEIKKNDKHRIDIRCTKKEKEMVQTLARDCGLSVSEYIKQKLFGRKMMIRYYDPNNKKYIGAEG